MQCFFIIVEIFKTCKTKSSLCCPRYLGPFIGRLYTLLPAVSGAIHMETVYSAARGISGHSHGDCIYSAARGISGHSHGDCILCSPRYLGPFTWRLYTLQPAVSRVIHMETVYSAAPVSRAIHRGTVLC